MQISTDPTTRKIEIIEDKNGAFEYYLRRGNHFYFRGHLSRWVIEFDAQRAAELTVRLKYNHHYEIKFL